MSHSYRKPYASVCGVVPASSDKKMAARGVRRVSNHSLRTAFIQDNFEEFIAPHRYECPHNDVWSWNRDGNQRLVTPRYRSSWELNAALTVGNEKTAQDAREWDDYALDYWKRIQRK